MECSWRAKERPSEGLPAGYTWETVQRDDFRSAVADPGSDAVLPLTTTDDLVIQLIPAAATQRRVQVRLMADLGFLTSGCTITPIGA